MFMFSCMEEQWGCGSSQPELWPRCVSSGPAAHWRKSHHEERGWVCQMSLHYCVFIFLQCITCHSCQRKFAQSVSEVKINFENILIHDKTILNISQQISVNWSMFMIFSLHSVTFCPCTNQIFCTVLIWSIYLSCYLGPGHTYSLKNKQTKKQCKLKTYLIAHLVNLLNIPIRLDKISNSCSKFWGPGSVCELT